MGCGIVILEQTKMPLVDRRFGGRRLITLTKLLLGGALTGTLIAWFLSGRVALMYQARADQQYQTQVYQAALQSYASALRFNSDLGHAWLNSGYVRQALHDDTGALADFARYIALHPDEPAGYRGRGVSYARMRQYSQALDALGAALQRDPYDAASLLERGRVLIALGQSQAALTDLSDSLALQPGNIDALLVRSGLYEAQNDP